jgi:hypothetical protein
MGTCWRAASWRSVRHSETGRKIEICFLISVDVIVIAFLKEKRKVPPGPKILLKQVKIDGESPASTR